MTSAFRYVLAVCLCAMLGLVAAACSENPPPETPAEAPPVALTPVPEKPPAPKPPPIELPPEPLSEEELFARMSLAELNSTAPLDNVFFDYDRSELRPEARAALQRNADWLNQWDSARIMVEGHCDERGTNEYNLGLGDRRAAAVRDYLTSLGISGTRVQIVSKGEEEPVCSDSQEDCWGRNRRGHFIITGK